MHAPFSAGDLVDGVHPTKSGYAKMALIWEPAIRAMLDAARPSEAGYPCGKSPRASSLDKIAPQSEQAALLRFATGFPGACDGEAQRAARAGVQDKKRS